LICFCPKNAPYVGGFILTEASPPIAGRGWFLSHRLFASAAGGRLPMPLAIIIVSPVSPTHHPCPKSEDAAQLMTDHGN
jgi:hypothetical protein